MNWLSKSSRGILINVEDFLDQKLLGFCSSLSIYLFYFQIEHSKRYEILHSPPGHNPSCWVRGWSGLWTALLNSMLDIVWMLSKHEMFDFMLLISCHSSDASAWRTSKKYAVGRKSSMALLLVINRYVFRCYNSWLKCLLIFFYWS